jgi:hypothetical protein
MCHVAFAGEARVSKTAKFANSMKTLLPIAALLSANMVCSGQGIVNFATGIYGRIATNSNVGGGSTGYIAAHSTGATYYFGLFVAPTSATSVGGLDPTSSGFTFAGAIGTNAALSHFSGNVSNDVIVCGVMVPGYPALSSANFVVAGWSANLGPSWSGVEAWLQTGSPAPGNVWYGVSDVAVSYQLGGGMMPVGALFGAGVGQIGGFTLGMFPTTVPEPTSLALLGVGAGMLIVLGRRKA